MFGYIRPSLDRLSEEEIERFRSVYCGLCHTLARRYGFSARFLLNYDFTFLAILLSQPDAPDCERCRCMVHPCKARCAMRSEQALDLAADRSVILFWWQLRDHIADHGFWKGLKYRLAGLLYRRAYQKARKLAPEFDEAVQRHLHDLGEREKACCASLDEAAEPFAALMADIAQCVESPVRRRILHQIFYHLGRWIYLIDAADDFTEDAREGRYNPLRYRYGLSADRLDGQIKTLLAQTLDQSIKQMASAYALWDYGVWTPILDSIFYESFYGIGKAVLDGSYHKPVRTDQLQKNKRLEDTV